MESADMREPQISESRLDLQNADEIFCWIWTVSQYVRTFKFTGDTVALALHRRGAVLMADDVVLEYRKRMLHAGPGALTFTQKLQADARRVGNDGRAA